MFMQKGNTFFPQGDGGFINYSYNSDGSCTHTDGKSLITSNLSELINNFLMFSPISILKIR